MCRKFIEMLSKFKKSIKYCTSVDTEACLLFIHIYNIIVFYYVRGFSKLNNSDLLLSISTVTQGQL
jgi:hypothetical protein